MLNWHWATPQATVQLNQSVGSSLFVLFSSLSKACALLRADYVIILEDVN